MRKPPRRRALPSVDFLSTATVLSTVLPTVLLAGLLVAGPSWSASVTEKKIYSARELAEMPAPGPNPYLSFLPAGAEVDWNYWNQKLAETARLRALKRGETARHLAKGGVAEIEPNDTIGTAQALADFGTGTGETSSAMINGSLAAFPAPTAFTPATEDDGDINSASATGMVSGELRTASGTIGDGPHGNTGTNNGDFDFYTVTGATPGAWVTIEVTTPEPTGQNDLDPNCAAWNSAGTLIGFNEDIDTQTNWDCRILLEVPADGTVHFSVQGFKLFFFGSPLPSDPFDSSSGSGAGSEGTYDVAFSLDAIDEDCFSVGLEIGDVIGTGTTGAALGVFIYDNDDTLEMGSGANLGGIYPEQSPLPATGVNAERIAFEAGDSTVCTVGFPGDYTLEVSAHRSVFEGQSGTRQILFVDFDGATVDPAIFGGESGSATLSPLADFLAGWGLTAGDEDAVIDAILASMEETISQDLAGLANSQFGVEIRNSRDHADPFGQPNVSRLIVGGTIAELGLQTIGIAQSIDPGNFGTAETGVTLLDLLSAAASDPNSLNQFSLGGGATMIDLVGTGVGNITAHEAGHFLGNWHTENDSSISAPSIMDQGGNLANSVGVGVDLVFGTADDVDVDFTTDAFVVGGGPFGTEHTGQRTAFALTLDSRIFVDGFESGNLEAWSSALP